MFAEWIRIRKVGTVFFVRDLLRPESDAELQKLVQTYAGDATPRQRQLFAESLHAALSLNEVRELVAKYGFNRDTVRVTSDRHWTWSALSLVEPEHSA